MRIRRLSDQTVEPADPNTFTGHATLTRMNGLSDDPSTNAYRVQFQPCARTDWHTHSGPQLLVILEGVCRLQREAEPTVEVEVGDVVCINPGERHWHGAGKDGPMTHLAINIASTTSWLEKVTEEEYGACAGMQPDQPVP